MLFSVEERERERERERESTLTNAEQVNNNIILVPHLDQKSDYPVT